MNIQKFIVVKRQPFPESQEAWMRLEELTGLPVFETMGGPEDVSVVELDLETHDRFLRLDTLERAAMVACAYCCRGRELFSVSGVVHHVHPTGNRFWRCDAGAIRKLQLEEWK